MTALKVVIAHLRQPRRDNPNERRDDPFYEFGSFGCTGCHGSNLLHSRRAEELVGARVAFAQGGELGFRLVFLTQPVTVRKWVDRCELLWSPATKPFKYSEAPVLVANDGSSDFPKLRAYLSDADRKSAMGQFSSCFRSRAQPLDDELAAEVVGVYEALRSEAGSDALASNYDETLPYAPPCIDPQRRATYDMHIDALHTTDRGVRMTLGSAIRPCRSGRVRET